MIKYTTLALSSFIALAITSPVKAQQSPPLMIMEFENKPDGTYTSEDQINQSSTQSVSLMCAFNMKSHAGITNVSYKIQGKILDTYFDLLESLSVSNDNIPIVLIMGPGVENATKLNKALPVPPVWRIVFNIAKQGQSGPVTVTGTLGCRIQ
jgi:hypothetical protein